MMIPMVDEGVMQRELENVSEKTRTVPRTSARHPFATASSEDGMETDALARELTDIIQLLNARGTRAPVPSWLVGRLVTYRDHLTRSFHDDGEPS